jgi:N-acetylneuraminic acid mutarotase
MIAAMASLACAGTSLADTWFPAAPMSEPRAAQTATLLPDGRVLVAGGYNGFVAGVGGSHTSLDLAELFDASTDTWTRAASMLVPRSSQTATLLPDGRVLLIGGWEKRAAGESGSTAEAYDPTSNSWSPVPVPAELQEVDSATPLPSGWVFLVGWFGPREYDAIQGAALYDPVSDTWERTAAPKHPRQGATTMLLADGNVLMLGGWTTESRFPPVETVYTVLSGAEEYDPNTNEWIEVASMNQPRGAATAALLPDGKVFVSGGVNALGDVPGLSYSAISSTEAYDPATNSWTVLAPMAIAREHHTATLLPGGDVLVAGGGDCGSGFCLGYGGSGNCCGASSAELYDPSTNTWSFTAPVLSGVQHTATLLPGGGLLIAGGNLEPANMYELSSAAIYASSYPPDEPPTVAGPNPIAPTPIPSPAITDATQTHRVWREGNALAHSSANGFKRPIGTTFSFTLNEQASVDLAFTHRTRGRKVKGRCVARTKVNRHRPTCERTVAAGVLSFIGHTGTNKVAFQGRISRSNKLKQGRYTLLITATNPNGARSTSKSLSFTIVK